MLHNRIVLVQYFQIGPNMRPIPASPILTESPFHGVQKHVVENCRRQIQKGFGRIALRVRRIILRSKDVNLFALPVRGSLLPEEEVTKKSCRIRDARDNCFHTCPKSGTPTRISEKGACQIKVPRKITNAQT